MPWSRRAAGTVVYVRARAVRTLVPYSGGNARSLLLWLLAATLPGAPEEPVLDERGVYAEGESIAFPAYVALHDVDVLPRSAGLGTEFALALQLEAGAEPLAAREAACQLAPPARSRASPSSSASAPRARALALLAHPKLCTRARTLDDADDDADDGARPHSKQRRLKTLDWYALTNALPPTDVDRLYARPRPERLALQASALATGHEQVAAFITRLPDGVRGGHLLAAHYADAFAPVALVQAAYYARPSALATARGLAALVALLNDKRGRGARVAAGLWPAKLVAMAHALPDRRLPALELPAAAALPRRLAFEAGAGSAAFASWTRGLRRSRSTLGRVRAAGAAAEPEDVFGAEHTETLVSAGALVAVTDDAYTTGRALETVRALRRALGQFARVLLFEHAGALPGLDEVEARAHDEGVDGVLEFVVPAASARASSERGALVSAADDVIARRYWSLRASAVCVLEAHALGDERLTAVLEELVRRDGDAAAAAEPQRTLLLLGDPYATSGAPREDDCGTPFTDLCHAARRGAFPRASLVPFSETGLVAGVGALDASEHAALRARVVTRASLASTVFTYVNSLEELPPDVLAASPLLVTCRTHVDAVFALDAHEVEVADAAAAAVVAAGAAGNAARRRRLGAALHSAHKWLLLRDTRELLRVRALAHEHSRVPSAANHTTTVAEVRVLGSGRALAGGVYVHEGGGHRRCCGAANYVSLAEHAPHAYSARVFSARALAADLGPVPIARATVLLVTTDTGTRDDVLGAAALATERVYIVTPRGDDAALDRVLATRARPPWTLLRTQFAVALDHVESAIRPPPDAVEEPDADADGVVHRRVSVRHRRLAARTLSSRRVTLHGVLDTRALASVPWRALGDVCVASVAALRAASARFLAGERPAALVPAARAPARARRLYCFSAVLPRDRLAAMSDNETTEALRARALALAEPELAVHSEYAYPSATRAANVLPEVRAHMTTSAEEFETYGVTVLVKLVAGAPALARAYLERERELARVRGATADEVDAHCGAIERAIAGTAPLLERDDAAPLALTLMRARTGLYALFGLEPEAPPVVE